MEDQKKPTQAEIDAILALITPAEHKAKKEPKQPENQLLKDVLKIITPVN